MMSQRVGQIPTALKEAILLPLLITWPPLNMVTAIQVLKYHGQAQRHSQRGAKPKVCYGSRLSHVSDPFPHSCSTRKMKTTQRLLIGQEKPPHCFHCSDWLWQQEGGATYMAWSGAVKKESLCTPLLCHCSDQMLELGIESQLQGLLEKTDDLDPVQFDIQPNSGTETNLFSLVDNLSWKLNEGDVTACASPNNNDCNEKATFIGIQILREA